jgi:co-chaperonin GroES (HSP10)
MSDLTPLGARVTLRVAKTPNKVGSLWVPPEAQESTYGVCQAEIVAVGDGVRDQRLQPGLRVITRRFGGFPHDEARQVWSVWEHDVMAIVDESAL